MEKFDKENKRKFLLGDFNVDLLKIDEDPNSSSYFDTMTSNLFVPHIIHPTRITSTTKTLIDNIFSNSTNYAEGISGNFTFSLSDHLAQFLIIPGEGQHSTNKKTQYARNMKNFDREHFFLELYEIDWTNILNLQSNDPNVAFENLQKKKRFNKLLFTITKIDKKSYKTKAKSLDY